MNDNQKYFSLKFFSKGKKYPLKAFFTSLFLKIMKDIGFGYFPDIFFSKGCKK